MSKIYDALRKAAHEGSESAERPDEPPRSHPAPVTETPPGPSPDVPLPPPPVPADFQRTPGEDDLPALSGEFARELSNLRASIEQVLPESTQRTLLVAGSVPGEGASTVAARFAQFLGEDDRLRVALVDADMRNAEARPVELVEPGSGLASVLAGSMSPRDAVRPTGFGNLDVLPSEGVAADPYSLCTPDRVQPFLNYLRGQYHYAVLDAAPVLSAPETALLADLVDGVILVIRSGRTKREVIQRSLDRLRSYRATVLGVVMNRQQYVIPEFIYRRL
jgi:capsular exopolysaccharide synthesis family protein